MNPAGFLDTRVPLRGARGDFSRAAPWRHGADTRVPVARPTGAKIRRAAWYFPARAAVNSKRASEPPPAASPGGRRDEQRRRIVDAAARIFARDGFAGASVASILSRAGVGRGTFYRHFRDLEDVLLAVEKEAADRVFRAVSEKVRAQSEPEKRLYAAVTGYLLELTRSADLLRVLHREARGNSEAHDRVRQDAMERFVTLFREGVADAQTRGLVASVPDDITLFALAAALRGVGWRYLMAHQEEHALEAAPSLLAMFAKVLAG
jgi:AcrR family transcriptional regulator